MTRVRRTLLAGLLALAASGACARAPELRPSTRPSFSAERLLDHIRVLSSDEFEGRAPGSKGEDLTIGYIEKQFRSIGLEPGNPDGGYLQRVPLVGIAAAPEMRLAFSGHGRALAAAYREHFVAWTKRIEETVSVDADVVFAGYGVQAPEFQWDDFKGMDVRGKVLLVLINDPPVEDERVFGGKAMTYYGRWTYKFEKAADLGAAACFIVHETGPAGYPWEVVRGSWSGEQFDLAAPGKNRVAIEGWITEAQAGALLALAGKDLAELKKAAVRRDFRPLPLGVRARLEIHNRLRRVDSRNVIARLAGSDPRLEGDHLLYMAHWDHFGVATDGRIYHGARDNASGVAALIEIARAFKGLDPPPRRSILFLATTAEEQGLLGSQYYAEHPLRPLARTAAVVNIDGLNVLGRSRDIVMIGRGQSTLDEIVDAAAGEQQRVVRGDPEPEKGYFYRSDHFPLAKQGVPAFDPESGIDYVGKPEGWGLRMREQYVAEDYHKPSDVIRSDWNLSGAVEDCALFLRVGELVGDAEEVPEWKPGSEFKAARESLRAAEGRR